MKLDNFVTFGRPQYGTMIIQLMTELDVSNGQITHQQYQKRLESKTMHLFLRLKYHVKMHIFENV